MDKARCQGCGAPLQPQASECAYCGRPVARLDLISLFRAGGITANQLLRVILYADDRAVQVVEEEEERL